MNREERRAMAKRLKKKGVKNAAELVTAYEKANKIRENVGVESSSPPQSISEGDKVKLNVELIKSRKNYENMLDGYKDFVNDNADSIFTAHVERESIISMVEEPKWFFWSGDLIKCKSDEDTEN
jgi:hypothetical protein